MATHSPNPTPTIPADAWRRYVMALDELSQRLERICGALNGAGVPFALVGGQAVALWVATKDPAAVRTTNDIDILLRPEDLPAARAAAASVALDYFEVQGIGMFLERDDPNPRKGVQIVWAGQPVIYGQTIAAPSVDERDTSLAEAPVVRLPALVMMKLLANRDQDRVHLRDMIGVGLVTRNTLGEVPESVRERLSALLGEFGL